MDIRISKHAQVLVNYSLKIKREETLLISTEYQGLDLAKECYRLAILAGAYPKIEITSPEVQEIFFKNSTNQQLQFVHDIDESNLKWYDARLTILGTNNTRTLAGIEPEKTTLFRQARSKLSQIMNQRMLANQVRWCGTQHPAIGNAQDAKMSIQEYADFVYSACLVEQKDPVAAWQEIEEKQEVLCNYLNKRSTIHFVAKDTDLKMSIAERKWVNCCGCVNLPDGEIFTGPVEDSVEGYIRFSYPGIMAGHEIEDIRLTFKKGKVVEATASKGEKLLQKILNTDIGAKYVGEIAIGTNYGITKFTKNMLFDEKIGGTIHLALGQSLPQSLGKNQSAIHWDMLCDMANGKIFADDKLIYQNKQFCI